MTTEQNEFKTGHEILKLIEKEDPWISDKIRAYAKEQGNEDLFLHRYGNAQAMVRQTFVWHQTKEGHEFWAEFSHTLRFIK